MKPVARFASLLFALPGLGAAPALAELPAVPADRSMQVVIARSAQAGCEPQCLEWIAAQGRIDAGTPAQFKKVFARLGKRKLPILIDSAGGSVDDAIAIGRLVRAKGLDVVVTQTSFQPCAKADAGCRKLEAGGVHPALPRARLSKCASSCAFILAGGSRRFVGPATFVGLHQVASFQVQTRVLNTYRVTTRYQWGVPVEQKKMLIAQKKVGETRKETATTEKTYARIKAYFVEMGVAESVMALLMSAPHSSIRILTAAELTATALATERLHGEHLLLGTASGTAVLAGFRPPAGAFDPNTIGIQSLCGQLAGFALWCPSTPPTAQTGLPVVVPASPTAATPESRPVPPDKAAIEKAAPAAVPGEPAKPTSVP